MLRKLLKHEFRATGRIMLPLFGILLLVSVGANFSSRGMLNSDSSLLRTLGTIFIMLFIVGIFAVGDHLFCVDDQPVLQKSPAGRGLRNDDPSGVRPPTDLEQAHRLYRLVRRHCCGDRSLLLHHGL